MFSGNIDNIADRETKASTNMGTNNNDKKIFALLVCGSRSINNKSTIYEKLDFLLSQKSLDHEILIIEGGARGVDSIAGSYARDRGYELEVFPARWNDYGKRAGYIRNVLMHKFIADYDDRGCVAFWDGISKGTAHNFKLARDNGTPLKIVRM